MSGDNPPRDIIDPIGDEDKNKENTSGGKSKDNKESTTSGSKAKKKKDSYKEDEDEL
jgi:hypothetical protein